MRQPEKIAPFRFKISGNLIRELGEESISNPNVAILELIRNAYDADATKVEISIVSRNSPDDAKIVVSDNGIGMTYGDLENKWMIIASPHKSVVTKTSLGRIPVGAKGIGRLASESLGKKTVLRSCPKGESNGYEIHYNWEEYRKNNVQCNDVNNDGYRFQKPKGEQGTSLEISSLRTSWNDNDKLKALLKDVYLIHPLNASQSDFKVIPEDGFSGISLKRPSRKLLDWAVYRLKAKLQAKNSIKYSFYVGNQKHSEHAATLNTPLDCGDVDFELYFWYRIAGPYEERLKKKPSAKELEEIKSFLDEFGGLKLYRDNFRVKPYGEPGFDWIALETEAQVNTMCPRTNQVVGIVNISKLTNPRIVDTTTREGVIFSREFSDLVMFIQTAITKIFIDKRSEIEFEKKKARKLQKAKKERRVVNVRRIKSKEEDLIDVKGNYPQNFYYKLQDEINGCYKPNYPNAAFFLCRKLVENLVFNILEKKFPSDVDLWYDKATMYHLPMSVLVKNLFDKRDQFKPNARRYIEKFNTDVGTFKKEANAKAHNIFEYLTNKDELKKFKINDLVQLLLNVYQSI
ncbi:MAG: ATP-binding protein [Candidatus Zixiibacteriota bacterium]